MFISIIIETSLHYTGANAFVNYPGTHMNEKQLKNI